MRIRLTVVLLGVALALASPAAASACGPTSRLLYIRQGSAMAAVQSNCTIPLDFKISAGQAIKVAETSPTLRSLHRTLRPLHVVPYVWRGTSPYWYVVFTYRGKIVGDAAVSPAGRLTGAWTGAQARAPYTHGKQAAILDTWLVLLPFSLLFLVPFLDPRRLRRLVHLVFWSRPCGWSIRR
jgi:hypothetical protein